MKVLVVGAERFMGIHAITRLYRDHYRVVGVYRTDEPQYTAKVPHSKYVVRDNRSLKEVFYSEKPDVVVYTDLRQIHNTEESVAKISEISTLAELSVTYETSRFIYLSHISVYGDEIAFEVQPPVALELAAKTHLVCEQILASFRPSNRFFNIILRLPQVSGVYETLDQASVVYRMVEEQFSDGKIQHGVFDSQYLITSGDVSEAIVRSMNDSVDGIFNIVPATKTPGYEVANEIARELRRRGLAFVEPISIYLDTQMSHSLQHFGQKAAMQMGLVLRNQLSSLVNDVIAWHQNPQRIHNQVERTRKSIDSGLLRTLENIALFAIMAGVTYWQTGSNDVFVNQYLTIYLIFVSIVLGINQGIFAAILVSLYYMFHSLASGYSLVATFSNVNILLQMVQALVIAMSIGYVLERKNFTIEEKERTIEELSKETQILQQINHDLGQIKMEQETRILKYETGLGKLYASIKSLNSLSQQDIFWGTLTSIRNLTDEQNISLYIRQPNSHYMRRLVFIGEQPKLFSKSYNINENDVLKDIVLNDRFYTNQYLNPNMPSVILPIKVENQVTVLVIIENMAFEKLTLYYMNVLHITKDLLDDAYRNAHIYETLSSQNTYEENSPIMKQEAFEKYLAFAQKGFESSGIEYTILELPSGNSVETLDMACNARKFLRDTDEIGRLRSHSVAIVLLSTGIKDAKKVIERLAKNGITTKIMTS